MGMVHNELVRNVLLPKREDCLEYLRKVKWKGTVRCSYCCSSDVWSDGVTPKGARKYQCQRCHRYFNDLTGTIFEHHHFPVEEMFYILKEMEAKSTNQISHELDRDYDSVLRFVHEVQQIASQRAQGFSLEGIVELDETYVHSGKKGVKQKKPWVRGLRKRGRGTWKDDKPPVMTMVKRGNTQRSDSKS